MQAFQIDTMAYEEVSQSRRYDRGDPWALEPNLTKVATLDYLLSKLWFSKLAARALAENPVVSLREELRYQDHYPSQRGTWDLECNGYLYRYFDGGIYRKRVVSAI